MRICEPARSQCRPIGSGANCEKLCKSWVKQETAAQCEFFNGTTGDSQGAASTSSCATTKTRKQCWEEYEPLSCLTGPGFPI